MSDSYQAIYDAVRSQISNGDIGTAVENAIREASISHYAGMAAARIQEAASAYDNPSVLYRPKLYQDGNQWCALYGEDLQVGFAAFGDSPQQAMYNFDVAWYKKIPQKGESDEQG